MLKKLDAFLLGDEATAEDKAWIHGVYAIGTVVSLLVLVIAY